MTYRELLIMLLNKLQTMRGSELDDEVAWESLKRDCIQNEQEIYYFNNPEMNYPEK